MAVTKPSSAAATAASADLSSSEEAAALVMAMEVDDDDDVVVEMDAVDQAHAGDPKWVAEYASEIFAYYFEVETVHLAPSSYMSTQHDIRPDMRHLLIDWLVEVHMMFKMKEETLFLAVNILDRYLSTQQMKRTSLQLVGSTALLVASKYEELNVPELADFVYVSDQAFTRDDVVKFESEFCTSLGFIFSIPTPFHFGQRFIQVAAFDERNRLFASYLMELALLDYSFLQYAPSVIAASAVYLTTYFDGQPWADHLVSHTRYVYADMRLCVKEMYALLANDKMENSVQKKYSSKTRKRVAQIGQEVVAAQIRQHQEQSGGQ
jgi:cyclin B